MIRGYVVLVARGSPLPAIPSPTAFYRKAGLDLSTHAFDDGRFFINVEGTDYAFQVKLQLNMFVITVNRV